MDFGVIFTAADSPEAINIQNYTLAKLALSALHIRATYYTIVAGFVVYCYDILLTLEDEAALLWSKGGRFVKTLYTLNRYLPFAGLLLITYINNPVRTRPLSDKICKATFILAQLCQAIEIVVATSIFIIRIYTIYHGHKYAQRLLLMVLILSHITLLTLMAFSCVTIAQTMFYSPKIRFCVGTPNALSGALYLTPIVIESFIVFMTLVHAVTFGRRQSEMGQTAAASILRTLYLDGCIYYIIICGLRMATALVFYLAPKTLILLMPYFEYALTSAVTSRWFLSFRRTLVNTFSTQHDTTQSGIPFTGPTINFGNRRKGSGQQDSRRRHTFLSSYAPRSHQSLRQDELPVEVGFSNSMTHELRALDSHPQE